MRKIHLQLGPPRLVCLRWVTVGLSAPPGVSSGHNGSVPSRQSAPTATQRVPNVISVAAHPSDHPVDSLQRDVEHLDLGMGHDHRLVCSQYMFKNGKLSPQFPKLCLDWGIVRAGHVICQTAADSPLSRANGPQEMIDLRLVRRHCPRHPVNDMNRREERDACFSTGFPNDPHLCFKRAASQRRGLMLARQDRSFNKSSAW